MIIINVIKTNHVKCAMMPYKCLFIHSSLIFHNGNEAYRFIQKFFVSNLCSYEIKKKKLQRKIIRFSLR